MTNIIRPNFGGHGRGTEPAASVEAPIEHHPIHVYGTAAGYVVALLEDMRGQEGPAFKVVVGPAAGNAIEAVAVMPATDGGHVDADTTAMAVLRALEIVEQGNAPASA